ncbi:MAG: D-aminoacyl-tRNA deacylase [Halobacteriota archaeon]
MDDASKNVARHLLKRAPWAQCAERPAQWTYGNLQLVLIKNRFIKQEKLIRELNADLIIFSSRHESEKQKGPVFTAHFTGNINGSQSRGPILARAAPRALKLVMERLRRLSDIKVLVEVTHHCPCTINIPSLFVEIGSSRSEWTNDALGDIMARAILSLDSPSLNKKCITAVGFGGPHYAQRHTEILANSEICYGHIFATYQLEHLSAAIVQEAFDKSDAKFAYFDRKQIGAEKGRLKSIVNSLGHEVLRKSDIENHGDISWEKYLQIRRTLRKYGVTFDGINIQISESLRNCLATNSLSLEYLKLKRVELNPAIIKLACAVDIKSFKLLIEVENIVYLERKDGRIAEIFVSAESSSIDVTSALLAGCIKILKKRYEVEYSQQKSKLYISERKFNARLARSLGVAEGPLFAKLAHGEPIRINSKVIKPEDVFTKVKKAFDVASADKFDQH